MQDEKLALKAENLMGQIDSRIDNLESWIYDDEDDE